MKTHSITQARHNIFSQNCRTLSLVMLICLVPYTSNGYAQQAPTPNEPPPEPVISEEPVNSELKDSVQV